MIRLPPAGDLHRPCAHHRRRSPSLSGLACIFETRLREQSVGNKVEYLAGLWSGSLVEGLGWGSLGAPGTRGLPPPPSIPLPGSTGYWAPSWSWASVDGHSGHGTTQLGWEDVAAVAGWDLKPLNAANPYSEVADGWLVLRAPRLLPLAPSGEPESDAEQLPSIARRYLRLCLPRGDAYGTTLCSITRCTGARRHGPERWKRACFCFCCLRRIRTRGTGSCTWA
jgi:hypothetical protein